MLPLLVPEEAPHDIETLGELREVFVYEDEGRLVVVRLSRPRPCLSSWLTQALSPRSSSAFTAVRRSRCPSLRPFTLIRTVSCADQHTESALSPVKPLPFAHRAELAKAYPSLSIHHVALSRAEGQAIRRALRFEVAPRWLVCVGWPQQRMLVRRQVSNEEN